MEGRLRLTFIFWRLIFEFAGWKLISVPKVHSSKHDRGLWRAWWIPVKKSPFVITHPVSRWCIHSTLVLFLNFSSPEFFMFHARYARLLVGFSFSAGWTSSSSNSCLLTSPLGRFVCMKHVFLTSRRETVNSSSFTVSFYSSLFDYQVNLIMQKTRI